MDEMERRQFELNKNIRGYIIRSLVKGYRYSLILRQLVRVMVDDGVIISPDIGAHLHYLEQRGYIAFTNDNAKAYTAYRDDAVVQLTDKGIDLVEGTTVDPGVCV